MVGHVSRLLLIFILLVLSGFLLTIICMFRETVVFDQRIFEVHQIQRSVHTVFKPPEILRPLDINTYCARFGQEPTVEEAKEERDLLNSMAWPGPLVQGLPVELSSDPAKSYFVIQGSSTQQLGGQLLVTVYVQDFLGLPKNHGGDFLIARLHSPELGAGVAGKVHDHQDGTYTVLFPLLWAGVAWVEITMVHPSEAVVVLKRLQEEQPDRVFFKSLFISGNLSETTVCNLCLPLNQNPLCNYTDPLTGEPWYCYKPEKLGCDTRINHYKGGYKTNLLSKYEAQFFQSDVNIKIPIPASVMDKVIVLPTEEGQAKVKNSYIPAGYYLHDTWTPLNGAVIQQFNDSSAITHCLRGKAVYMFGDSTVRQWFEYLSAVPNLQQVIPYRPKKTGPFMAEDKRNNILVSYRCHGPPIRFGTVPSSQLRYVANELDKIQGGPDTVVLVSVWSHFSTYPVEIYIRRLRHIRRAVVRLLNREPATLVVIRTANLQEIYSESSLFNSDWFSLQRDVVLRAMFRGLRVQLLDAWEMTLAHHLPHDIHPPHSIIKNMIDLILTYICPVGKI
ncbi:NXPE family member 3-like isoform X1 [Neoarius graeffei]|uniref:NXPE family member 3-like isoform X1 n=1 Tax=Neoarius graeffei TaxID=443677 RepID=UPI00298D331F|nr:NXPE family member 3-like isoform X1 [Neoarius graeffei]XP_060785547.1 NXPE family member 3-like isoform X1 [Neoarius graeffei]XP_060785548.1 NXPE family member 3-like isoform X1 [Neoarius graeffei]